ncbi:MAG TPA: TonB-dependent receptor [Caulobacteraceae bacterium]|jgi:iron complex outermembrane receptor protein|nr:TonB-dependent receptor [Caulobacteraceae bacterium]
MTMKKIGWLTTSALAASLAAANAAVAQSTAGQVQEVVVTGSRTPPSTLGLATHINEAKDQVVVGQQFIATQTPSANLAQLIQMAPGVSYSTEDPGGFNSGDLRIHGYDGNHVAVIFDGAPLNDTGNYAVYPGEYMIGELVDHFTLNAGGTDVDSPSAAALGATINVVSKIPPKTAGGQLKVSGGSYGYYRAFGEIDTGTFGPWGATAYLAAEEGHEDNYKGRPGYSNRWDISGRIYQPLKGSDFISLAGIYTQELQFPAFRVSQSVMNSAGKFFLGDNYYWQPETARAGVADTVPTGVGPAGADTNFYRLFPNPVKFASLRGQSRFDLGSSLTFTFDPNFFYTLANGGASLSSISEKDKRLIGASTAAGVDLNKDGDVLDTVAVYGPSNTETYRAGLTSSLLWEASPQHHFQLAYTLDYGHHRQTGEVTTVDPATGVPADYFGAKSGYGAPIATADGTFLRNRDRLSIAILNQISANYIGKFLDDALHVNVGVRDPYFERKLHQHCYTYNGTSAYCDTVSSSTVQAAYNTDLAAHRAIGVSAAALTSVLGTNITTGVGGAPNFRFPFDGDVKYNKLLPNAGVSYRFNNDHMVYATYNKGFAAPKTDDLYASIPENVLPETSDNYAVGYRYQTRMFNLSVSLYDSEYRNHIVQSVDPNDPTLSIDRNVGDVRIQGADIELGFNPTDQLHFYGSANFNKSELLANYTLTTGGVTFALPVKGKELVLTPSAMISGRVSYDFGPLTVGFEGKYTGKRYVSDTNDLSIPSFTVFNIDARYTLPFFNGKSYVQVNVSNVFDKFYISRSTTFANGVAYPIPGTALTYSPSTAAYYVGAPMTGYVTLGMNF